MKNINKKSLEKALENIDGFKRLGMITAKQAEYQRKELETEFK